MYILNFILVNYKQNNQSAKYLSIFMKRGGIEYLVSMIAALDFESMESPVKVTASISYIIKLIEAYVSRHKDNEQKNGKVY